jgi:CheY-like chemotaxis protein
LAGDVTHRVLVVEDDATLRKVIRMVLERDGYEVVEAPHGADAWSWMQDAIPSAAVVDMRMPIMDGGQLLRHMREDTRTAGIPVVIMSGFGERSEGAQADAVIAKPFDPQHLLEVLRSLVSRSA